MPGSYGTLAWGDYDNDGDLDLLSRGAVQAIIYRNDDGQFVDSGADMVGFFDSWVAWGDVDNDDDLDALVMGNFLGGYYTRVYRNNIAIPNDPPTAPSNLTVTTHNISATLGWSVAHDVQSPATGLTYNLRIGTTPGGFDVLAPMAQTSAGDRRLPQSGNAGARTSWTIRSLAPNTYLLERAGDRQRARRLAPSLRSTSSPRREWRASICQPTPSPSRMARWW